MIKKLMKVDEYSDGTTGWRIACDCHDPNHDCRLWFERDLDFNTVSLSLSMEMGFYPSYENFIGSMWRRIKHAAKVLFTGYATVQGDMILDEDGIKAMQAALKEGLAHAKANNRSK